MKDRSKILLSKKELNVLAEAEFFHLKRKITSKIFEELAETVLAIKNSSAFQKVTFPEGSDIIHGKISKGENYLGLPFIILDFPRLFTPEKISAFRTMVWWGNFVSTIFIVSGTESKAVKKKLLQRYSSLTKGEVFICVSDSPWHHHFAKDNFVLLKSIPKTELNKKLEQSTFVKLARKIPITQIENLKEFSVESFKLFAPLLEGR